MEDVKLRAQVQQQAVYERPELAHCELSTATFGESEAFSEHPVSSVQLQVQELAGQLSSEVAKLVASLASRVL